MKKTVIIPTVPARIRRISPWYYGTAAVVVLVAAWVVCYAPRTIVVRDTQNYGTSFTADARLVLRDQNSAQIVYKDFPKVNVDSKGYKISYTPGWFELPRNMVADVCFKRGTAVGGDKLDSIPYCEGAVAPAKYVGYVIRSCDNHYVPWSLFSFSRTVEFSGLCNGQGQNLALASQIQDAAAVVAGEKDDNTTVIAGDTNGDGKVDGNDKKDGDNNSDSDTDNDNRTSLYVTNPTTTVTNRVDMQECEDDEVLVWDDNRWNCRDVDDLVTAGGGGSGGTGNFTDLFVTNNTTLNNLTTTGTSTFGGPTIFNSTTTFTTLPSIPLAPGNFLMGDVSGVGAPFAPGANGEVLTIVAGVPTWTPASGGGPTGDLVAGSNVVFTGSGVGKLVGATNVTVGISATPSFTSLTTTAGPNNFAGTTTMSGPVSFTGPTFTTSVGTTSTFNGPTNINNTLTTTGPNILGGTTTINDLNVTGTTTFTTAPNIPLPTDNIWVGNGSNVATPVAPGAAGQVLTIVGTTPTWAAPSGGGVTFTLAGSAGPSSVISGGDTLSVLAGTNMVTTGNGADGVTVATVTTPTFDSITTTVGPNTFGGNSTFGGPVTFNSTATFTTAPSIPLATGSIFVGNGANLAAAYGPGANGEVLTVVAGIPTWQPAGGSGTTALSALTPAVANNTINNGTFTQNWNFNSGGSLNLRQATGTTSNGLLSIEALGADIVSVPGDIQGITNIWNSRTTSNDIALSLRTNGAASQGTSLYLDNEGSGYLIYANDNGGVGAGLNSDTTPFVLDANGNVGIGVAAPSTKLQVTSTAANTSGVRLTNLTSASPTSVGQAIGVDASGNIVTVAGAVAPCVSTSNTICNGGNNNGGNNTGGTFIGTTDNQPLQFLANGTNTWKITPDVVTGGRLSTNISNPISILTNSNTTYTAQNGVSTNGPNSFVWEQNTAGGYGSAAQYAAVIAQTSLTSGSSLLLKAFRADNQTYLINANAGLGAGTDVFSVTSLGRVGINNNAPAQALDVNGTIRQTGAVSCTLMTNASGDIICTSDETRKDISGFYTNGLDALRQINPIAYTYKGEDAPRVGFSAQNIRSVLPEGAPIQRDGSLGLDSNAVVALTVSAVKDLDAVVTEQGKAIAELQAKRGVPTDGSAVPADVVDQLSKLDASSQTFQTELGTLFDAVTDQQETLNDLLATLSDLQIDVRDLRVDVATLQAEVKALANGGNSKITAKTQFTADVVGRTEVKKGDTRVHVRFENNFDEKPVITLSAHKLLKGNYALDKVDTDGFDIELAEAQDADVSFDWHAFDGGEIDTRGDSSGAAPVAPATTEPTPADPPLSDPLVPVGIE